jgi:hypothetical protein
VEAANAADAAKVANAANAAEAAKAAEAALKAVVAAKEAYEVDPEARESYRDAAVKKHAREELAKQLAKQAVVA